MQIIPELLTVREVAALLKVSPDPRLVSRRFQNLPDVIDLGSKEKRYKRAYKVLRIPRNVLERFLHSKRVA
jgi:hypothetical protein